MNKFISLITDDLELIFTHCKVDNCFATHSFGIYGAQPTKSLPKILRQSLRKVLCLK